MDRMVIIQIPFQYAQYHNPTYTVSYLQLRIPCITHCAYSYSYSY